MSRKPDAVRFRRQAVVGPHLVDLYCPAAKIVADLDAPAVGTESDAYLTRIAEIEKAGVRVLRFRGASVISAIDETCDAIIAECVKRLERSNSSQ